MTQQSLNSLLHDYMESNSFSTFSSELEAMEFTWGEVTEAIEDLRETIGELSSQEISKIIELFNSITNK